MQAERMGLDYGGIMCYPLKPLSLDWMIVQLLPWSNRYAFQFNCLFDLLTFGLNSKLSSESSFCYVPRKPQQPFQLIRRFIHIILFSWVIVEHIKNKQLITPLLNEIDQICPNQTHFCLKFDIESTIIIVLISLMVIRNNSMIFTPLLLV